MTAEVAIANASAVALAADSAVTIGGQKIYNSALKLFSLSKIAPVGIMIYGSASLLNVPWEILIKSYRNQLGATTFNSLTEYSSDFINYLNTHPNAFPKSEQTNWLKSSTRNYFQYIKDDFLKETVHPTFEKEGEIGADKIKESFSNIVVKHHSFLQKKDYVDNTGINKFKNIRKKYISVFREAREDVFEKMPISRNITAKLYDIAAYLHVKQVFSTDKSGVVIAGYGETELYPSIETYDIEGIVESHLRYRKNIDKCHSLDSGSGCIIAFAQEDMVNTFMQGINPSINELLQSYLHVLFDRLPELLDDQIFNDKSKKAFNKKTNMLLKVFLSKLSDHVRDEHSDPVLRMVTVLPKDELAAMAEALVNLTAFKRRITDSMETVGGPIDVAVISKGDGLIWVKRKHYFPSDLNQHFFRNYFRGVQNAN